MTDTVGKAVINPKPQKKGALNRMLEKFTYRIKFNRSALNIRAADLLRKEIERQGIKQADLAAKLGMSPARLSQILNIEDRNLTLGTIAGVATALDKAFELALIDDRHAPGAKNIISNTETFSDNKPISIPSEFQIFQAEIKETIHAGQSPLNLGKSQISQY